MAQGKLPAIQFYPGDWRKDIGVQSLSFHDRGVWFEILLLMHESERRGLLILNGRAMSDDALGRILGLDKQNLTTTLSNLLTSGVASRDEETGALMSRRMVRDENIRKIRAEAGSKGGNPVLVKQNPTTPVKQNPTPSSSSSVSSSPSVNTGDDHPITPEMVASGVISETRLSGKDLRVILEEVCKSELPHWPAPGDLRDAMVAAWREYETAKSEGKFTVYAKAPEKFFGGGDWRNKAAWPWKEGQQPKPRRIYANEVPA